MRILCQGQLFGDAANYNRRTHYNLTRAYFLSLIKISALLANGMSERNTESKFNLFPSTIEALIDFHMRIIFNIRSKFSHCHCIVTL